MSYHVHPKDVTFERASSSVIVNVETLFVRDPVAEFISLYFELSGENAKIDVSEGVGEIDHFTIESAVDYSRLPENTKRMQGHIEVIGGDVEAIRSELRDLMCFLLRVFDFDSG